MTEYWQACDACNLYKSCTSPRVPLYGSYDARVLVIGEAPSAYDSVKGMPFSSEAGLLLRETLTAVGFDLADIAFANTVRCRPPGNIPPTKENIESCVINTYLDILSMPNLKIVLLVGAAALNAFTGRTGILKAHGTSIIIDGIKYYPTMHPAAIIKDPTKHDKFVHGIYTFYRIFESDAKVKADDLNYVLVDTVQKFDDMMVVLNAAENICVDIESSGLKPFVHDAKVVGIGLGVVEKTAYFVPLDHSSRTFQGSDYDHVRAYLTGLLCDPDKKKFGHNVKFDSLYLEVCWGIETHGWSYDTMLGAYCLDENRRHYGLKPLALEFTDMGDYEAELGNYLESMGLTMGDMFKIPVDILAKYCCSDIDATIRIRDLQEPILRKDKDCEYVFDTLLMPGSELSKDIEKAGIAIDSDYLAELEVSVPKEMAELDVKLRTYPEVDVAEKKVMALSKKKKNPIQEPMNFGSSPQLGKLLFEEFKLPIIQVSKKTNKPSTNKKVIEALAKMHEFPKTLMQWKLLSSAYTKYVSKIRPDWLQEKDGRVHGQYLLHGTRTGRYASSHPNMQNIPRDTRIKNIFVPKPGCVFVHADYSQVELRVLAIFSEDQMMTTAFKNGEDIHTATAAVVAGIPVAELQAQINAGDAVAKDRRRIAKTINFGLLYGMGAYKLANILACSEEEGELFISNYFSKLPGVKRFIDKTHKLVKKQLHVTSLFGRKRRLPYAASRDLKQASQAERQSVNSIIQSTAADMTLSAMISVNSYLKENHLLARIVMTVHDSIVIECPLDEVAEVSEALKSIMENLPFSWITVPIVADVELGDKLGHLNMTQDSVFNMIAEENGDEDVRDPYAEFEDNEEVVRVVNNPG